MNELHANELQIMKNFRGRFSKYQIHSITAAIILLELASRTCLTMTELSVSCSTSTAAITGMVDLLEKKGLVERSHDLNDRRRVLVKLTDLGKLVV